jgi:hypothetical protein
MPNRTNDDLVKRHAELRETLIKNNAKRAAEKIVKLKKLSIEEVAQIIADEFRASPI